ncbi:D-2-hydroxyacid dehydrogenase [Roseomonas sp. OT10]|uniref:NAD(P)-dependent oxidoreductase n=1 Tax=Roseomonas cutis TaxID=2897332 RepID=UPI001E340AD0|nr:NAD(P)-dependent oxidoreductase [Roseomonas sp. OT10]UFN46949.1 D-2-hydroxyacid dehydrogenase [Roseomonas sp. OT10]
MRLHIQNPPGDDPLGITRAQWDSALARNPDMAGTAMSLSDDPAALVPALREAEVLLTWTKVAHDHLRRPDLRAIAPRLRVLAFTSAGLDRLLPFDWVPPDLVLVNNRGTHAEKAGEFGIMALLMLRNHIPLFAEQQREACWAPRLAPSLAGAVLGLVGLGTLGSAVAQRAKQFGMRVLGVRGTARPHPHCDEVLGESDLEQVLPRCDFLLLACPLTPRTRGLLSRERLSLLPRGAGVVNIARGAVWDQDAVCDLLEAGHLAAALTDVAVPEPLPPGHRLWRTKGMFITPHMSADDPLVYNDRTLDILFANLRAEREGRPLPNRVDPVRGY